MIKLLILASIAQLVNPADETIDLRSLPEPYANLDKMLSYDGHNWFARGNFRALAALIRHRQMQTIVEVGSWLGKSAISMASLLPEDGRVYAVDTWKGGVEEAYKVHADRLAIAYEQFLSNVIHENMTHKIVPVRMSSLSAAQALQNKVSPDLVYIDASHEEADVYDDLNAWWPYVENKGVLCGDDWRWPGVKRAVRRFAKEHDLRILATGNFWCYTKQEAALVSKFQIDSVITGGE